jgi:putative restriction endonuclease
VKFFLGVTDNGWFRYLAGINPEDVNFWQPSGTVNFKVLQPGEPFLFKLKSPLNAIGGMGFFSSHTFLPMSIAWDTFRNRNGCETYDAFRQMILNYRSDKGNINPTIGCIVLTNPIFFHPQDWIETPADWGKSIVQGKSYDSTDSIGKHIWTQVESLLEKYLLTQSTDEGKSQLILEEPNTPLYGNSMLKKVRLGQGAFRVLVTDAYNRRCSITGEKTLPVLEAAHIKAYAESGPNFISNGLLLRSDIHKLFDSGYLTITTELQIEVSSRIKEEFQNGKEYYQYHGQELLYLPNREFDKPDPKYIEWHNTNVYRG